MGPNSGPGPKVLADAPKPKTLMLDRTKGVRDLGKGQIVARVICSSWPRIKPNLKWRVKSQTRVVVNMGLGSGVSCH